MFEISPLGNSFPLISSNPVVKKPIRELTGLPQDSFNLTGSYTAPFIMPSALSMPVEVQDAVSAKSNAVISGTGYTGSDNYTGSTAAKTENVPTFLSSLDSFGSKLNFWLPWDEAQSLSSELKRFGDTRDSALRMFDGIKNERNFALEAMQQKLEEIARRKDEIQNQLEQKKLEEERKKTEQENIENQMDKLKDSGNKQEIESRINELNSDISGRKSSVSSKEEKIAQLKEEMEKNPEKKDELQSQINDLKSQVSEEKKELQQKQEEKRKLEEEKKKKEQEAEEARIKKEELNAKKEQLKDELKKLEEEERSILEMVGANQIESDTLKSDIDQDKSKLERLDWLFNQFEYETRGL